MIARALDALAGDDACIGLAVSGGSDSLGLLHHAQAWARACNRTLFVATVDHGLRPEAAAEAASVASRCRGLKIAHDTLVWRPPQSRPSQAATRLARYGLLADWAAQRQIGAIALGHTLDDRLETFLIRARAGSSWYGLAGPMPAAAAPAPTKHPLRLIRPLLTTTRQTLRTDLTEAGIQWVEDPTNAARRHERVRVRQLLAATTPETRASIQRSMTRLALLRASVIAGARAALTDIDIANDDASIPPGLLAKLTAQSRLRLLETLIQCYAPRTAPLQSARLQTVAENLTSAAATTSRTTLGNCTVRRSRKGVVIAPAPPRRTGAHPPIPAPDPARRARELLMDPYASLLRT